ncbi:hypothetical protein [Acidianus sp. HS-5]|uniref:hypothetical protein n=1 Tax=Acidianus sp. HS-5 TaxID=2886040 RepID=UPI001F3710AD|nr:hypothetical protein [Acidianus sp. HS-5]BDC17652.1 hypothetical protein HS5_05420 [Acidianus sp. HS-5]
MAYTTIKVTDEVRAKLMKIAGELKAEKGDNISINDVLQYLISLYEERKRNKKPLNMHDFDELIIEMDENSSEKIDDVVYG